MRHYRLAPQEVKVSGMVVCIWMLPPWFSIVRDDNGTTWRRISDGKWLDDASV